MPNATSFEDVIRQYVINENGLFFALTDDNIFLRSLRTCFFKYLGLPTSALDVAQTTVKSKRLIEQYLKQGKKITIIIERMFANKSSLSTIKEFLANKATANIIVLTTEIERERLILLHELGVKNFITKPISVDQIIQKLAFTIQPPTLLGSLIDQGKEEFDAGHFDKALNLSEQVLDLKPGSPAGYMLKGDALKGLGRMEDALNAYVAAMEPSRLYLEPIKKLADFYKDNKDLGNQAKYLEKLDKLSPLNIDRKVDLGGVNVQMGNTERAEKYFDSALKVTQKIDKSLLSEVCKSIADTCVEKAPEMAEIFFKKSLDAKPTHGLEDIETFNSLGLALRKQGKWKEALAKYEQALKIAPKDENLHYNTALAHADGKQFSTAALHLDKALASNPGLGKKSITICINLGYIYLLAEIKTKAKQYFSIVLEMDPDNKRAKDMLRTL